MGYGDHEVKRRGIQEEIDIIPELIAAMEAKWDCEVKIKQSSLNENMKNKIDYHISISTPVRNIEIKADYKSGESLTLISNHGQNNLDKSQSDFIIMGKPNSFTFVKVDKLREVLKEWHPGLRNSKFDDSLYFFLGSYLHMTRQQFSKKELFHISKV